MSRASATQREGRAGRVRAGRCSRLFTKADFDTRNESDLPEIHRADLAETVLALAASGHEDLRFLDPPKEAAIVAARKLLGRLGALDSSGRATAIGKRMATFPLHPRLSRLCVAGEELGAVDDACGAAALLSERDIRENRGPFGSTQADEPTQGSDVGLLLDKLREAEGSHYAAHALRAIGLDARAVAAVRAARSDLVRRCRPRRDRSAAQTLGPAAADDALARALLLAFPDRFAKRQKKGSPRLAVAGGISATLSERSVVRDAPFMLAIDADQSRGVVVRLASAVSPAHVLDAFVDDVTEERELSWNAELARVEGTTRLLYDGVAFDETIETKPAGPDVAKRLARAALEAGLGRFGAEGELDAIFARARFAEARGLPVTVPDDAAIAAIVESVCEGKRSFRELEEAGLVAFLQASIDGLERLPTLCPPSLLLPSGRRVTVHYEPGKPPWIESFLQDFFGLKESPQVMGEPLVLHLLAPNKRSVQITRDLPSFFRTHYPPLRKELGRRYPKHAWPEDTSTPVPMRFARRS